MSEERATASEAESELLAGLNRPQREAVTTTDGPVLVLAGPGSGKTRVITHRIAYLVREKRVLPWNILAVTFTNKAAKEMAERLERLIGSDAKDVQMGTFHAICARVLRREAEGVSLGIDSHFTIYDDDDQQALVKKIVVDEMNLDAKQFKPRVIHSLISRAKNDLLGPGEYAENVNKYIEELAARAFMRYDTLLRENNAVDFDDLILLTYQLWRQNPAVLAQYQRRYRYIHVDEFQDTNKAQYELVRLLAAGTPETPGHGNVCAVGDDDQCLVKGTLITMADGSQHPIETIALGDFVRSSYGSGDFRSARVLKSAQREPAGEGIAITTRAGRRLVSTPEHTHFAGYRLGITPQVYFTYLMHKRGVGYRLGTSQVRTTRQKKPVVGFMLRARQEHADEVWVISTHENENEARVEEYILSLRYGIPTLPFVPRPGGSVNGLVHDERYLRRVFEAFDTEANAHRLLRGIGLSEEHPHFRPRSRISKRHHIIITLCGDRRGTTPMHRIAIVGNDLGSRRALEAIGLSVRAVKINSSSWRHETANASMAALLETASRICKAIDADVIFNARLGKNGGEIVESNSLPFTRASAVRPGMLLFDGEGGYDVVERVERVPLDVPVYDLDIEATHNFIANGIITHNSIYSWRGAIPRVVRDFQGDFPTVNVILLEQNYRSTQTILDAAQGVVRRNVGRNEKQLWTERRVGEQITIHEAYNEEEEAAYVVGEIRKLHARGEFALRDCAVMYRTNAQSRALEEACIRAGMPYVVVGSRKFYERKEIKDVLAYLRLLLNPSDSVSLARVINVPNRKIGPKTYNELVSWAQQEGRTVWEALGNIERHPTLATTAKRALAGFHTLLDDVRRVAHEKPLPEAIDFLLVHSGYAADLRDGSEEGEERWANVLELRRVAEDFSEIEPDVALELFLENVALVGGSDTTQTGDNGTLAHDEQHDSITLITLHAAKGLEFPVVFLTGLEEGVLPHSRSLESQHELEEERRLAYVGITRAMHRLYLVRAIRRSFFGGNMSYQEPSRFLGEIPGTLVVHTRQQAHAGPGTERAGQTFTRQRPTSQLGSRPGSNVLPSRAAPSGEAAGWGLPEEPDEPEPAAEPVKPGDRVAHRLFGPGLVLKVAQTADATTVEVLFDAKGKKTLDLAFAKLQKL
jgi:DNA helicase-2/ATP-dependent DNA helicase PcrA